MGVRGFCVWDISVVQEICTIKWILSLCKQNPTKPYRLRIWDQYRIHTVTFLPFRAYSIDNQLIIDTMVAKVWHQSIYQILWQVLEIVLSKVAAVWHQSPSEILWKVLKILLSLVAAAWHQSLSRILWQVLERKLFKNVAAWHQSPSGILWQVLEVMLSENVVN